MPHIDLDNPGVGHKQVQGVNQIEEKNNRGTWRVATKQEVEDAGALIYPTVFDPTAFLMSMIEEEEGGEKGAPLGWFKTQKEAVQAAREAGVYSQRGFQGDPIPGVAYPYDIIRNGLYFTHVSREVEATADKRFSLVVDPHTGHTYAIDQANPTKPRTDADIVFRAANKAPEGSFPIGNPIPLGNGKTMQPYTITDDKGVTTRYNVILEGDEAAPTADDIVTFTDDEGGGRLIPLGDGRYTYEAPPDAVFTTGPDDVVPLPKQGGSLIKTSENQYQFVRDTYEPGRKVDDSGREYLQQIDGSWTELAPRFQQGVVESRGREFLQQRTGALAELAPRFTPEVTDVDGMSLLQQRSGAISQLAKPNLDQIITQALVDGEYDKAFAFQDFRDRPSAAETFQTALEFARSPADQILISSIARGEQTVQPPPAGTIQRVGPQADFLVQAYQDFQRRTQAGRAPPEEEATTLSGRAAAGASPLTDTLQARLEGLTRDMERKDEAHAVKIEGMKQSLFEQGELFQVKLDTGLAKLGQLVSGGQPSVTVSTDGDGNGGNGGDSAGTGGDAPVDKGDKPPVKGDKPAGSEEEVQEAVEKEAAGERLTPEQIQHFQDFKDAKEAGFNPADYNNIASRAINAWKESVRVAEEQTAYEERVAKQATDIGWTSLTGEKGSDIEYKPGDIKDQEDFFRAIGISANPTYLKGGVWKEPTYQNIAAALGEDPDPQGTAAAAQALDLSQASAARDLMLTEKQSTPEHIAASGMGTQSSKDAMALIRDIETKAGYTPRAGGGTVRPGEITVVGEQGPEIAMMPPGTHILPLGRATKQDIKAAQSTGRAYQQGGIVFGELPFGIRQLQAGRPITPSRGYLSQAAGLTLPSAQALSNLTPESRDVYFDLARQAGIPSRAFGQELQTALPSGRRLPTSRMLPFSSRGVR